MIIIDGNTQAAIEKPNQAPRDFVEIRGRSRADQSPATAYLWSGGEQVSQSVIDPFTGAAISHVWEGAGHLVGVGDVPRVSSLTVSRVSIRLSGVSDYINDILRLYDPSYGTVILYRSFMDVEKGVFVSSGICRFVGTADQVKINTSAENGESYADLTVKSLTQDLTRSSTAYRSDAFQKKRAQSDTFRKYAATIADRKFTWATK